MFTVLRHLIGWVINVFRSRQDLMLENLALRQQLLTLHAQRPGRRLSTPQKWFWVMLRCFFEETGIGVDWELSEQIWRLACRAFQADAERRRKQRDRARAASLWTSLLAHMHLQTDSAFSPWTRVYIAQPSQA